MKPLLLFPCLLALALGLVSANGADYTLSRAVIGSGGTYHHGTVTQGYQLRGATMGQVTGGAPPEASFRFWPGFWSPHTYEPPRILDFRYDQGELYFRFVGTADRSFAFQLTGNLGFWPRGEYLRFNENGDYRVNFPALQEDTSFYVRIDDMTEWLGD
jgi:hypothetical protein